MDLLRGQLTVTVGIYLFKRRERGALLFREQQLDHAEHMSVARLFGPLLTRHPFARLTSRRPGAGHPDGLTEIIRIVHDADDIARMFEEMGCEVMNAADVREKLALTKRAPV